jgi:glycosyltransferase involved in cell wall biosynthesis
MPFLFDMRGFWPDEGVGVGRWAQGSFTHRLLKALERVLLRRAGGMVTLTESGAAHLRGNFPEAGGRPVAVIPTCADLDRFHPSPAGLPSPLVLGYAGSANEAYLFEEFLLTFRELRRRRPDATMLILNRHDHDYIHRELAAKGISPSSVEVKAVDHEQMPEEMRRITIGTIFVRPYLAKIGSAPTKMAEFLATGVPCLGNSGCGDVAAILERERVGISIDDFTADKIAQMIDRLLRLLDDRELPGRCRQCADQLFSMENACRAYDGLYDVMRQAHPSAS